MLFSRGKGELGGALINCFTEQTGCLKCSGCSLVVASGSLLLRGLLLDKGKIFLRPAAVVKYRLGSSFWGCN